MTEFEAFGGLDASDEGARVEGKRDRLARLLSVLRVLQAHGDAGISPAEIARRTGMSKRTIYRDLDALQSEIGVPIWSDERAVGRRSRRVPAAARAHLLRGDGRVPVRTARGPLRRRVRRRTSPPRSRSSARRCRPRCAEHVERTLDDARPAAAWTPTSAATCRPATRAWAERRVVRFRYDAGALRRAPSARPREADGPSRTCSSPRSPTHALYLIGWDETRDAIRTFKVERIRDLSLTPQTFERARGGRPRGDAPARVGHHLGPARDRRGAAVRAGGRGPGPRGDVAPEPGGRASWTTARSTGGRGSRARSRSGSGSCRGATRWRCSSRRSCARTWPRRTPAPPRATHAAPDDGRGRSGHRPQAAVRAPSTSSATRSTATWS